MLYSIVIARMFTFVCEKGEEQWRKWHARPHKQTDGPAGNCIARIGTDTRNCSLSFSFYRLLASLSGRLSFPGCVRGPMSSFLPTYDRQPTTCPCVSCPVHPSVRSSIRSPSTQRFTLPREPKWQRLFPENSSQIEWNFQGTYATGEPHGLTECCSI